MFVRREEDTVKEEKKKKRKEKKGKGKERKEGGRRRRGRRGGTACTHVYTPPMLSNTSVSSFNHYYHGKEEGRGRGQGEQGKPIAIAANGGEKYCRTIELLIAIAGVAREAREREREREKRRISDNEIIVGSSFDRGINPRASIRYLNGLSRVNFISRCDIRQVSREIVAFRNAECPHVLELTALPAQIR